MVSWEAWSHMCLLIGQSLLAVGVKYSEHDLMSPMISFMDVKYQDKFQTFSLDGYIQKVSFAVQDLICISHS